MSRDYKNINKHAKKAEKKSGSLVSHLFTFVTGLSVGAFIAAYIFMRPSLPWLNAGNTPQGAKASANDKQAANDNKAKTKDTGRLTLPKFEFYDILRNRKLNISERIASEQEQQNTNIDDNNVYLLQAGSFKEYKSADTLKAKLALIGITSYITTIVLNGNDSRYRVRIGPFDDADKLRKTSQLLKDNDFHYMLVKLELQDGQG